MNGRIKRKNLVSFVIGGKELITVVGRLLSSQNADKVLYYRVFKLLFFLQNGQTVFGFRYNVCGWNCIQRTFFNFLCEEVQG